MFDTAFAAASELGLTPLITDAAAAADNDDTSDVDEKVNAALDNDDGSYDEGDT